MPAIEVPDWYRTVALVGQDATGTPVVVLLDSTGAIISIMKGEYAGTLKNVQVDSQGRMIMIPTDPADVWGNAISMGNAELVARLTGLGGYDRRGQAIWQTGFEDGFPSWTTGTTGTGAEVILSSSQALFGGTCLKLRAGSGAGGNAWASKLVRYPKLGKLGAEYSFSLNGAVGRVRLYFYLWDGAHYYPAVIQYDHTNSKLQYSDSTGNFQDIETSYGLYIQPTIFHTWKLVCDFNTKKYVRLLLDDELYLLPYDLQEVDDAATKPVLKVQPSIYSDTSAVADLFVDGIIITQNEPA